MKRSLPPLPSNVDPQFLVWARAVEMQLLTLPELSVISTANGPNVSGRTGSPGALAVDIGSSVTRLWQKYSASTSTTGWSAYSRIP